MGFAANRVSEGARPSSTRVHARRLDKLDDMCVLILLSLLVPEILWADSECGMPAVCRPHAEAYDAGTWRWLPNATFRSQLPSAPKTASADVQERAHEEGGEGDGAGDVAMTDATVSEVIYCTLHETNKHSHLVDSEPAGAPAASLAVAADRRRLGGRSSGDTGRRRDRWGHQKPRNSLPAGKSVSRPCPSTSNRLLRVKVEAD